MAPFRICSLPGVFCYLMSQVLSGLDFRFTYLDDIVIYSTSWEEHLQCLEAVYNYLKGANLKIKLSKCQFFKWHLHYLRHLISEQGTQPAPDKIMAITNLAEPENADGLHHFLRLTGYYRKFVPLFGDIMKPLNTLLRKNIKFQWSVQCQLAFKHLKNALCKKPILQYPDISKLHPLFRDTSNYAYSGILIQAVDRPNDQWPIAYTSGFFLWHVGKISCNREGSLCSLPVSFEICLASKRSTMHPTLGS